MSDDPRKLGGGIAGPGGPYDKDAVVIDMRNAVLLDGSVVAVVETRRGESSELAFALELQGRVNKTDDRTTILYVLNGDGVAALVVELLAVASRAGETELREEVMRRLEERMRDVPQ